MFSIRLRYKGSIRVRLSGFGGLGFRFYGLMFRVQGLSLGFEGSRVMRVLSGFLKAF